MFGIEIIDASLLPAMLVALTGLALGFGAGVTVITIVPGLNLVAMPAAVIGATLLWCDRFRGHAGELS